jgi:hypothetical protein
LQEQASNHLKLLWSKAMVVSVKEKSQLRLWQVRIRETRGNLVTVCAAPGVKVA